MLGRHGALAHYGVGMADGEVVAADSFVMKGSGPLAGNVWRGNPACPVDNQTMAR